MLDRSVQMFNILADARSGDGRLVARDQWPSTPGEPSGPEDRSRPCDQRQLSSRANDGWLLAAQASLRFLSSAPLSRFTAELSPLARKAARYRSGYVGDCS